MQHLWRKPEEYFYKEEYGIYLDDYMRNRKYKEIEPRTIDWNLAEEWVNIHASEEGRDLARKLLSNIRLFSLEEFNQDIAEFAEKINAQISSSDYVLLIEPGRSSEYMAHLVLPYLKFKPAAILNIGSNYFPEFENRLANIKQVVFLEDGAFSGSQIKAYIENHIRPKFHYRNHRQVLVGACYTTARARAMMEDILSSSGSTVFGKNLQTLEDYLTVDELKLQESLCERYGLIPYGQVLTLFPHNNLDGKSFPGNVLSGSAIVEGKGLGAIVDSLGAFIGRVTKPYD